MKKNIISSAISGVALSAALVAMCSSCGISNSDSDRGEAKEEMKEELNEIHQEGAAAFEAQNDSAARQDSLKQIEAMVNTVEEANKNTGDWQAKYNNSFFNNTSNKAPTPSATKYAQTQSGLKYVVVNPGNGAQPTANQTVTVHYTGILPDGTVFDSSVARGEPTTFPLNRVIPGWTEGLQYMKTGGTSVFYIPSDLAYGANGVPGTIPPNTPLIFWVQLLSVN